ncbi:hypothetical protein, partial [Cronobacter sakazakii]
MLLSKLFGLERLFYFKKKFESSLFAIIEIMPLNNFKEEKKSFSHKIRCCHLFFPFLVRSTLCGILVLPDGNHSGLMVI